VAADLLDARSYPVPVAVPFGAMTPCAEGAVKFSALLRGFGILARDASLRGDRRFETKTVRLRCRWFWLDSSIGCLDGRCVASVDTPDGPSLGWGATPREALIEALQPFDGIIDELLEGADGIV
jgi:hypothetical protein